MSLSVAFAACQTAKSQEDKESRQAALLEQQKQLVRTALDSGKPDQALGALRQLLAERPDDAGVHNLMGLTQLALRNSDRAVRHFRRAYKLDPLPAIGLNLSSAYIENGDFDRAIALLKGMSKEKSVTKDPETGKPGYLYRERIYHNLGYAYVKQKQYAKAQQWFQEALDENPTFFPSHLELARVHERLGRPAMAMRAYRTAMDYCHVCFEPVKALATILMKSGKQADARLLLHRFTKIDGVETPDRLEAERMMKLATGTPTAPKKAG